MSRAIIGQQSSYRPMFDRRSADSTNQQISKNGDQWKRNYNLDVSTKKSSADKKIGLNIGRLPPDLPNLNHCDRRPTVCLGNANAILLRLKIHARWAYPFFLVCHGHEEQLCAGESVGTDRLIWILDKINLCNILVMARYRNESDYLCICTF